MEYSALLVCTGVVVSSGWTSAVWYKGIGEPDIHSPVGEEVADSNRVGTSFRGPGHKLYIIVTHVFIPV